MDIATGQLRLAICIYIGKQKRDRGEREIERGSLYSGNCFLNVNGQRLKLSASAELETTVNCNSTETFSRNLRTAVTSFRPKSKYLIS